ncbi:MAG: hypothetical protein WCC64_18030 [Aliidongia sp.]
MQDASLALGPFDSDQDIIIDQSHRRLFAVNSGSDTIAVFDIGGNGSLTPVKGSPFPSGGVDPVSVGLSDNNTLVVVNKNGDFSRLFPVQPNYTTLHINGDGSLSPLPNVTPVQVAYGASPSQAFTIPGTNLAFGTDFIGGLIESFTVDLTGQLRQHLPMALPANPAIPQFFAQELGLGNFPQGMWSHPFAPLLYVGFPTGGLVGVYRYDVDGNLEFIRSVPDSGTAVCWLRTNSAGTRLYAGNRGAVSDSTSTVSVFDLTDPETPVEIQTVTLLGLGNVAQISLDPNGSTLYVITQRASSSIPVGQGNALHVLTILSDGTVAENTPPIPLNVTDPAEAQGVAVYAPN